MNLASFKSDLCASGGCYKNYMDVSISFGFLCMGVMKTRSLLFGVPVRALIVGNCQMKTTPHF